MKHLILVSLLLSVLGSACKKSDSNTPVTDKFLSITAGSTWNYATYDSVALIPGSYTLTATSRDSTISGRSYRVFTRSTGGNDFYAIAGNDYYNFQELSAALGSSNQVENLYLKDNSAVGTSWVQNFTINANGFSVPVTVTNTIAEKGINKTVRGIAYSNAIHVTTAISSSLVPASGLLTDIHTYYAPKYGTIASRNKVTINFMGINRNVNTTSELVSATIL